MSRTTVRIAVLVSAAWLAAGCGEKQPETSVPKEMKPLVPLNAAGSGDGKAPKKAPAGPSGTAD